MSLLLFNQLNAIKPLQPIIMLSHMRAYTSLFGHILGSNPEINGYYEMHMGYYSWKSFFRQKLLFLEKHRFKSNSRFIFDKVLHNEHHINTDLLLNKKTHIIISLRMPAETIPSIIRLFQNSNPDHEFTTVDGAVKYYKERLNKLVDYSRLLENNFIYLDAGLIRKQPEQVFTFLKQELGLKYPLRSEYDVQALTGIRSSGDSSEALKGGKIINKKSDNSDIKIDSNLLNELNHHYALCRKEIISYAKISF